MTDAGRRLERRRQWSCYAVAGQHLQRACALSATSLLELLMSVRSATEILHEQRLARLEAHEAEARLEIDAQELGAPAGAGPTAGKLPHLPHSAIVSHDPVR